MTIPNINLKELVEAGVHFGHKSQRWNPKMLKYIHSTRENIHIINLNYTVQMLSEALKVIDDVVSKGGKILFVATKKQAKDIVSESSKKINMPYITERWPGGLLTNFSTIRKSIKKMQSIDKMMEDGTVDTLSKRERLQISRQRSKLELNFGSIVKMTRMPEAIFIVDTNKEHIAVAEAKKLGIRSFAMNDTNTNPKLVDFPIPSNDDAAKSISCILEVIKSAVQEGLEERAAAQSKKADEKKEKAKKITEEK